MFNKPKKEFNPRVDFGLDLNFSRINLKTACFVRNIEEMNIEEFQWTPYAFLDLTLLSSKEWGIPLNLKMGCYVDWPDFGDERKLRWFPRASIEMKQQNFWILGGDNGRSSLSFNPEKVHAVVVGISDYGDKSIPDLKYAAADAKKFYEVLTDRTKGGLKEENVKLLLNSDATLIGIRKALWNWLHVRAKEDTTVIIFFAGYGGLDEDRTGTQSDGLAKFIIPYDAERDAFYATAISTQDLTNMLNTLTSKRVVMFFDSCYSGETTKPSTRCIAATGLKPSVVKANPFEGLKGKGKTIITASKLNQVASEYESLKHGVFTYYLLRGLSGTAKSDGDKYVTIQGLYQYVQDKAKEFGNRQVPVLIGSSTNFAVAMDEVSPPVVRIIRPSEEKVKSEIVELAAEIEDKFLSIKEVRVLLNGQEVTKRTVVAMPGKRPFQMQLELKDGWNRIEVVASNGIKEGRDSKTVMCDPQFDPTKVYRKKIALVMGVDDYPNLPPKSQLSYAVADAEAVEKLLREDFGFEVRLLTNPTKAQMENELARLTDKQHISERDGVVVFFAGHGQSVKLPEGEMGFLLPSDANADLDDSTNAAGYISTCIPMSSLKNKYAKAMPAKHRLFLLDCCFSGLAAERGMRSPSKELREQQLKLWSKARAAQVITAGGKGQKVPELGEVGHGAFTHELMKSLKGMADWDRNGIITAAELAADLKNRMAKHKLIPRMGTYFNSEGEFMFVR